MIADSLTSKNPAIEDLLEQFSSGSARKRRSLISAVESRSDEISALGGSLLSSYDPEGEDWSAGWILQVLQRHQTEALQKILISCPSGWFASPSSVGINYGALQKNLLEQDFEEADRFTNSILRKLAGAGAESRGYVYFSEVGSIPDLDLVTLDRLWIAYSQGKFGFSVQSRLLRALSGRYDRLWPRIGWKIDGVWTRYPSAFTWSMNAPEGHMPLINQLRGVRLMDALLKHRALIPRI